VWFGIGHPRFEGAKQVTVHRKPLLDYNVESLTTLNTTTALLLTFTIPPGTTSEDVASENNLVPADFEIMSSVKSELLKFTGAFPTTDATYSAAQLAKLAANSTASATTARYIIHLAKPISMLETGAATVQFKGQPRDRPQITGEAKQVALVHGGYVGYRAEVRVKDQTTAELFIIFDSALPTEHRGKAALKGPMLVSVDLGTSQLTWDNNTAPTFPLELSNPTTNTYKVTTTLKGAGLAPNNSLIGGGKVSLKLGTITAPDSADDNGYVNYFLNQDLEWVDWTR